MATDVDEAIRAAAFAYVQDRLDRSGDSSAGTNSSPSPSGANAFDAQVLGVRPDYVVEIRSDVLAEHDGPTLQHALQGLHGELIILPRRRIEQPSKDLLEERYERFRAAV